jgi:hypothetical protein
VIQYVEGLCLYGVEVGEAVFVKGFEIWLLESTSRQRRESQQSCVWRGNLWEHDVMQVELCKSFCLHPVLRYQADVVVVCNRFKDWDCETEPVLLLLQSTRYQYGGILATPFASEY